MLRQSRSTKTLSRQAPLPSMLIAILFLISTLVKSWLVNWLPWTPFCLSSGDAGLIDLPVASCDDVEDLTGDVALEGANSIELRMTSAGASGDVGLRRWIGSDPPNGYNVQGAVG